MLSRRRITRILAAFVGLLLWVGQSAPPAAAAGTQPPGDHITLTRLVAQKAMSADASGPVELDASATYQLQSAPRAFVLLFIFKDNAATATESTASRKWVNAGTGQVSLSTSFQPDSGMHTWTVVAAVFKDDQTLLAWTATQPFTLGQWPGRSFFDKALIDRRSGDYSQAVDDLTSAIQVAPQTGQYYCWRADSRVHLGQYDQAIADYGRALQLTPDDRSCQVGLGVALLWAGKQQQAVSDLTSVIDASQRADRWTVLALRARGIAFADLGQYSDAIADYREYLRLVPTASDQSQINNWIVDLQTAVSQNNSSAGSG